MDGDQSSEDRQVAKREARELREREAKEQSLAAKDELSRQRAVWAAMPLVDLEAEAVVELEAALMRETGGFGGETSLEDDKRMSLAIWEWAERGLPLLSLEISCRRMVGKGIVDFMQDLGHVRPVDAMLTSGTASWSDCKASFALSSESLDLAEFSKRWLLREWRRERTPEPASELLGSGAGAVNVEFEDAKKLAKRFYRRKPGAAEELAAGGKLALALIAQEFDQDGRVELMDAKVVERGLELIKRVFISGGGLESIGKDMDLVRTSAGQLRERCRQRLEWVRPMEIAFSSDSISVMKALLAGADEAGVVLSKGNSCMHVAYDEDAEFGEGSHQACSLIWLALSCEAFGCAGQLMARGFELGLERDALESKRWSKNPLRAFNGGNLCQEPVRRLHLEVGMEMARASLDRGWAGSRQEAAQWVEKLSERSRQSRQGNKKTGQVEFWESCSLSLSAELHKWSRGMEGVELARASSGSRI